MTKVLLHVSDGLRPARKTTGGVLKPLLVPPGHFAPSRHATTEKAIKWY
jgi:hypothetical protein